MNKNHVFIRLDGPSKGFWEGSRIRTVLCDTHAEFARGELVAILGRSGSGKSTLLNLITGAHRPPCLLGGCGARRGKAGRPDHPRQRHVEMNGCAGSMQGRY